MLQTIRRNRRSVIGITIALVVALVMTGFGVDFMRPADRGRAAVTVNGRTITHEEFYRQRRNLEERYRSMFGANYTQFMRSLNLNLGQQTFDRIVRAEIVGKDAAEKGIAAGDNQVRAAIIRMLGGQFDGAKYAGFLSQSGMTGAQFETQLREDILQQMYDGVFRDVAAIPSAREAKLLAARLETTYTAQVAEAAPEKFEGQVPSPSDEQLKSYYDDHSTDYEQPAQVAYDYVAFAPARFEKKVEVSSDDVDAYYVDNESEFKTGKQVKVRHIQLNFPKENDPVKMADVRSRAEALRDKLMSGESIEELARINSDDIKTRFTGGDLGWLSTGKMPKEFDEAVFDMSSPGVAKLIEVDYGFHVAKVEEIKTSAVKPLEEVRGDIESKLRKLDAPAYASAAAEETFAAWDKSEKSLADIAKEQGLEIGSQALSEEKKDPADLAGLTKEVLENGEEPKQVVELRNVTVLVAVKEYKEARIADFAEVKDKVKTAYVKSEAQKLAKAAADKLLAELASGDAKAGAVVEPAKFAEQAKTLGLEVHTQKDLKIDGNLITAPFVETEARETFFETTKAHSVLPTVFLARGKYYVVQAESITPPTEATIVSKTKDFEIRAISNLAQSLVTANFNRLRARAEIDFDENLVVEQQPELDGELPAGFDLNALAAEPLGEDA